MTLPATHATPLPDRHDSAASGAGPHTVIRRGVTWTRSEIDFNKRRTIKPGEKGHKTVAPHSEVCIHMGIAGLVVGIELIERRYPDWTNYSVQLYGPDGQRYSAPVLTGEGGLFEDSWDAETRTATFYYYGPKDE